MRHFIVDEHAWMEDECLRAEVKIKNDNKECFLITGEMVIRSENDTFSQEKYCLMSVEAKTSKRYILAEYDSFEPCHESEYLDFFLIVKRMLKEIAGKYKKNQYNILQKRTRMTDNYYKKIPESEIEIQFMDGEILFLFAYQADSFVEYGISKRSWLDQEEEGASIQRDVDILESYDSMQECMASDYAALFLELNEMMANAEDYPDELFEDDEELPGYYAYE